MPRYNYRCEVCEYAWEEDHPIAERDTPLAQGCPACGPLGKIERYLPSTNGLCYSLETKKVPGAFKDLLKNIKSKHYGSTMRTD